MYTLCPILVQALTPCVGAAVAWRRGEQLMLTAIVKATFRWVAGGRAEVVAPRALVERERHFERSPERSLEAASDVAPFLPRAEVLVHGSAYPATDPTGASVRLRVGRDAAHAGAGAVDKTLHVIGDAVAGARQPFASLPVSWERSLFHVDNPAGKTSLPNVLDPRDPLRPAGFAPMAWNWPPRLRKLGAIDRQALLAPIARYPADFDFEFFHAAPEDQRLPYLAGDERVLLSGWRPGGKSSETELPGARGFARASLSTRDGPSAFEEVPLAADLLVIDAEDQTLSLTWRGHRPFARDEAELAHVTLAVGVEVPPQRLEWPREPPLAAERSTLPTSTTLFAPSAAEKPPEEPWSPLPFVRASGERPPPERGARPSDYMRPPKRGAGDEETQLVDLASLAKQRAALPFVAESSDVDAEQLLPQRPGEAIPWVAAAPYDVGTHHWQVSPPQNLLIVVVKGSYDLVPGGAATPCERADFITGERHHGDDPQASAIAADDLAIFKPKADVLLVGHAYPPKRGAVAASVSFSFGQGDNRFERRIAVLGDRVWRRGLATVAGEPHAFDKVPLVYERAYGGPGYADNPVGRGYGDSPLMPNLELPGKLVTSPDDRRAPACFAPIAMEWPARWSLQGTYDKSWFKTRWPYFPADFDWTFFQAAPPEQRLAYLRGDEPFEIQGVHPELATIRGRLPGERARAFVVTRGAEPGFDEVVLRLDTVSFECDAMKVHLVWRGMFLTSDKDAPEVRALFALRQRLDAPEQTLEQAHRLLLETLTPEPEADEPLPPPQPAPIDRQAEAQRQAKLAELDARAAELERQLADEVAKANLPPEAWTAEPAPPDPQALAESLRIAGATEAEIANVLGALEPEETPPEPEPAPELPLRDRVLAMLADGASFAAFDFEAADLSDLDFSGRNLGGAQLGRASFQRASFAGADLSQAQLGEGDFSGASFEGADLTGADLFAAKLERASFKDARMSYAELGQAAGREADFRGARGESVAFVGGDWERARFDGAELTAASFAKARIGGASFIEAKLPKVVLRDATGPDARFDRADLTAVRGEGCKLHRASLRAISAPEAIFENAELLLADLRGAALRGSSFVRASCLKANFGQADLCESRLMRAKLTGASFERANLMMSRLDGADLGIADLRGANLHACSLVDANLLDAKLAGAITTKSSLVMKPFKP